MKQLLTTFFVALSIIAFAQSEQDSQLSRYSFGVEAGYGMFNMVYANTTPFWFNSFKGGGDHGKYESIQLQFLYRLNKAAISLHTGLMQGEINSSFSQDSMLILNTSTMQYEQTYVGMQSTGKYTYSYALASLQVEYLFFKRNRFQLSGFLGIGAKTLFKLTEVNQTTFQSVYNNFEVHNEFTDFPANKKLLLFSDAGVKVEYAISDSWCVWGSGFYNTTLYPDVKDVYTRYNRFYSFGSRLGLAFCF